MTPSKCATISPPGLNSSIGNQDSLTSKISYLQAMLTFILNFQTNHQIAVFSFKALFHSHTFSLKIYLKLNRLIKHTLQKKSILVLDNSIKRILVTWTWLESTLQAQPRGVNPSVNPLKLGLVIGEKGKRKIDEKFNLVINFTISG